MRASSTNIKAESAFPSLRRRAAKLWRGLTSPGRSSMALRKRSSANSMSSFLYATTPELKYAVPRTFL